MPSQLYSKLKGKVKNLNIEKKKEIQDKKNIIELDNKLNNMNISEEKNKIKTPIKPLKYKL